MVRPKLLRLVVAISLIVPLTVMTTRTAAASCATGRPADSQYYWAGASISNLSVTGVQSNMNNYDPYVYYGGFSYAWVMLAGPVNSWAQIGNYKSYNSRNVVIQVQNSVDGRRNFNYPARPAGTWSTYKITFGSGNTFTMWVDSSTYYINSKPWTPNYVSWAAETWQLSSQMMGGANNHQFLSYNKFLYAGTWQNSFANPGLTTTGPQDPDTYFGLGGSPYSYWTWDKSCAS